MKNRKKRSASRKQQQRPHVVDIDLPHVFGPLGNSLNFASPSVDQRAARFHALRNARASFEGGAGAAGLLGWSEEVWRTPRMSPALYREF